ncbi:hypothetical protein MYCTH_2301823 [Thermothelomyces thermophilus ATCC 42464]|uniref:Uncharacterized protein n=1 Tax=Thermothelomyces thermophilus (strain ATCC 42464 / BCRC 31852 / DSM 1799) TaxID=573729 RepID=G2QAB4_THET4|nr:uncharacterized protein MYCTH_2301823 [Thermothelomyces thermophilus ATCC 42464]AEO56664.1 hypothetical protein MYCTH_2301823 [Thermothelomyces thermophilus ATCC 42464]
MEFKLQLAESLNSVRTFWTLDEDDSLLRGGRISQNHFDAHWIPRFSSPAVLFPCVPFGIEGHSPQKCGYC